MPNPLIEQVLGGGGLVAGVLGAGYEARPEQLRMAAAVARTLEARSHLVVEAGTGVGKSFAYLVPSIERCLRGEVVVVATNTIALQEQLLGKDVPLLAGTLGGEGWSGELRAVLAKGRGNYLSVRRLRLASERQDRLLPDAASRRSLHVIEDWAYGTEDGSLSTLPALERPGVWSAVQSDSGNCMGRKCPTYDRCFYQSARRELENANLIVTNHALFFADLAMRAASGGDIGVLPRYDHVVLDEAHMIEDVAADHFGLSLSEGRVTHLLSALYHPRTGKGYLGNLELAAGDLQPIERAVQGVHRAEAASRAFFESWIELERSGAARGGRVREPGAVENTLTPAMNELVQQIRRLKEALPEGGAGEADRYELNAYAVRGKEIADAAEALTSHLIPGCCYWVETGGDPGEARPGRSRRVTVACSPIEVGPLLKAHLFEPRFSVVMTSATLATRTVEPDEPAERAETAFAHFLARVGCEGAETMQLGSPFDHAAQVEFFADRSMPEPGFGRAAAGFERALVSRVLEHVEATGGGAFVLFTAYSLLDRAAALLEGPLASLGYPMFVQGRGPGAGSRTALLEAFRESGNGVLLGAASFWQGVDVRGEALRNVIITRLPFDPPDRPLTEARLERIAERGGNPFVEDSIPRAVIKFKQGIGRLVRSHTDRGRIVVLDPRIVTKPYGRAFVRALPAGVEIRTISE
jgi:ATP-dependent DNA helicase DinG